MMVYLKICIFGIVLFLHCLIVNSEPSSTNEQASIQNARSTNQEKETDSGVNATNVVEVVNDKHNATIEIPSEESDKAKAEHVIEQIPAGHVAEEQQQSDSMKIFFILIVLALCILLTHVLLRFNFHFLPESIAVVFLGAAIGGIVKIMQTAGLGDWLAEEMLSPNTFFLMLLPPIIFEAGYNLHKGNFFQNFGSILLFAVFGTLISAMVVGGGIYLMGVAGIAYNLTLTDSFAFGSLVSAVDPVATIAIFKALNVDPTLNMLVFGESILNDAVSIVLTNTFQELQTDTITKDATKSSAFFIAVGNFLRMMVGSTVVGVLIGLVSALISFLHIQKLLQCNNTGNIF
ncbi:unnamed protein product [Clavelina lepadiformis]|uniref:Cation/H+ exchanger transmembrane domain-containing protein n=1 Tax=Clavelina lepadiformis TaxID=159417 RepID=A0ABP0GX83_CLALP